MERFSTLFGRKYDYEALSKGGGCYPSVDTVENLTLLSNIETADDVHLMHVRIGEELSGRLSYVRDIASADLREKGNDLFRRGKYEEALQKYYEATLINSFDVKNFTNMATTLMKLGRNEEALTIASIASDVDPTFPKVYFLMIKASLNLGFLEPALTYNISATEQIHGSELPAYVSEVKKLLTSVPEERRKAMDENELELTVKRLLSKDQGSPDVYSFLVQHLLELTAHSPAEKAQKNFPVLMQCLTETPYLNAFVSDPVNRISKISPAECRLIGSVLIQLRFHCEDDYATCEKLLKNATFTQFFAKLAVALTKRSTLEIAFQQMGSGYLFSSIFSGFIYLLSAIASKYEFVRNGFLKKTPPFNDFGFYAYLIILQLCYFDTQDSQHTNMFVESFTKVMLEQWCLREMNYSCRYEHKISVLATVSTIFLQCRSPQFRERQPPFASFLPFWLKLSKLKLFCEDIATRAGVWQHFAIRLHYATKDLNAYIEYDHHRSHLEDTLQVLTNMSHQPIYFRFKCLQAFVENIFHDEVTKHLLTALFTLMKFCASKSKAQLPDFLDSLAIKVVELLTSLLEASPDFAEKTLAFTQDSVLQVLTTLAYSKFRSVKVTSAAFVCLEVLARYLKPAQYADFANTPNFPTFVEKLIEHIALSSKWQRFSIEILSKLVEASPQDGRIFKVLATSNPYGVVKGIAQFIHLSEGAELNAVCLLAKLLPSSIVFSDAISHLGEETVKSILNSAQVKLESCKSDTERKMFEELVAILKT